jgi:hypothetical protein
MRAHVICCRQPACQFSFVSERERRPQVEGFFRLSFLSRSPSRALAMSFGRVLSLDELAVIGVHDPDEVSETCCSFGGAEPYPKPPIRPRVLPQRPLSRGAMCLAWPALDARAAFRLQCRGDTRPFEARLCGRYVGRFSLGACARTREASARRRFGRLGGSSSAATLGPFVRRRVAGTALHH